MTAQQVPFFKCEMQGDGTLEMLVYDKIGESYDGSGVTLKDIKDQIDGAGHFKKIVVRLNSPGGDAFEGVAIHNLLQAQKVPVQTIVDGVAASSASIIMMAGSTRTMAKNSMVMIHNPWSVAVGDSRDMRKLADTLDKVGDSIAQSFTVSGNSLDDIKTMMSAETWMSADDALANGFATDITEQEEGQAMAMARTFKSLKGFKTVPDQFKNDDGDPEPDKTPDLGCVCNCKNCIAENCSDCSATDCTGVGCEDCPMQTDDTPEASNLSLFEARLAMLKYV